MTREEKRATITAPAIAYYSGFGGIEIKSIEYGLDDHIIFVAGAWCSNKTAHRARVYYETETPYFKYNGNRIPLDECIRV